MELGAPEVFINATRRRGEARIQKLYSHNIVIMSGENGDTRSRLPIPDPYGLVI